jgi:hypothetical protein
MQPQTFGVLVGVVVVVTLNDHTVTQILDSSYS